MTAVLVLKLILTPVDAPEHDARATECVYDDYACLAAHDQRVVDIALLAREPELCKQAVVPQACEQEFRFGGSF